MGVGIDLLGKHVRCPHCKQVVLAPSTTASPAASSTAPHPSPKLTTPIAPDPDSASLNFSLPKKREGADSILSDATDSDDEVFSLPRGKKSPSPVLPDVPHVSEPPKTEPLPAPPEMPSGSELPTIELRKISAVEGAMAQNSSKPFQPTTPAPIVVHTPPPAATASPFAFEPSPAPAPVSPKQAPQLTPKPKTSPALLSLDESPNEAAKPDRGVRPRAAAASGSDRYKTLVFILAPYAAVVTALAAYGLFFKSSQKLDPGHPLSTIPDNFGEFDPAARKKVTQLKIDVDAPLPGHLRTGLGKAIEIGQLEIEPVAVEARPLTIVQESKIAGQSARNATSSPALVLHLRVKNNSPDLAFCPLDPAFNRRTGVDKIGTQIVVGKQNFYGGHIGWPFTANLKRVYEEMQEADATPLKPGETRDYVVCSDTDSRLRKAVRDSADPILWRVQVRRGLIDFKGKEVPVTAIIGVEFRAADVKNLN